MNEKTSIQVDIERRALYYMRSGVAFSRAYAQAFIEALSERMPAGEPALEKPLRD